LSKAFAIDGRHYFSLRAIPVMDTILQDWQQLMRSFDAWQFTLLYLVLEFLAIASAVEAIIKTRTAQGAIAWSMGLVMMPMLVLPLYLVFGRRKFRGYRRARIRGKHKMQLAAARAFKLLQPVLAVPSPYPVLEKIVQMPATTGNHAELLINGVNAFPRMFAAIEAAKHYVLLQFYIVRDDELGEQLKLLLAKKAAQGVEIFFLFDEIGSLKLGSDYVDELQACGVRIFPFNSTKGWHNRFQLNFRNHRKLLVADGEVGFLGGLNIGREYVDRDAVLTPWRDTQVLLRGPAVACLQIAFMEDWYWAREEVPELRWQVDAVERPGVSVLIALSGPADTLETCEWVFLELINSAQRRLWIVSMHWRWRYCVVSMCASCCRRIRTTFWFTCRRIRICVNRCTRAFAFIAFAKGFCIRRCYCSTITPPRSAVPILITVRSG